MIHTITYPPKSSRPAMGGYRYFFNGQEADNEVLGEGILHAFEYRMHDTRLGRFWSVDPLAGKFPWNSVYAFAENRVVDGRELEGLERGANKPLTTSKVEIPMRVVSACDNTRVVPTVSPKKNLEFQKTKMVYTPDPGEIRPAMSVYEKEWKLHAASFENSLRSDIVARSISTGGFFVTSYLFGGYVASDVLPYAVKGGEELYSVGLKIYNNPWGKRAIGVTSGIIANEQKWSPDINFPDPLINIYSQSTQFFLYSLEKANPFFYMNPKKNAAVNTNNNEKPNHTQSTEKENQPSR